MVLLEVIKDFLGINNVPQPLEADSCTMGEIKESKLEELRDLTKKLNGG